MAKPGFAKWVLMLLIAIAASLSACMDPDKTEYIALPPCPVDTAMRSDTIPDVPEDSSPIRIIKRPPYEKYEVCGDSLGRAVVTIQASGEHQVLFNGSNVYKSNGVMRIWIGGLFRDENEIRILENGKTVFVIHFLDPT